MKACKFIELAKKNMSSTGLFKTIDIKEYLPLLVKKSIADRLSDSQITFINGLACSDTVLNAIFLDIAIIEAYTNISFSENDALSEYEEMAVLGLVEMLKLRIGNDCVLVENYFNTRVAELTKLYNSFEGLASRNLSIITERVIGALDEIQKSVSKETLTETLNVLQGFDLTSILQNVKKTLFTDGKR